jgi:hypothetical protein
MREPAKSATYSPRRHTGDHNDVRWPPGIGRFNGGHEPVRRFCPPIAVFCRRASATSLVNSHANGIDWASCSRIRGSKAERTRRPSTVRPCSAADAEFFKPVRHATAVTSCSAARADARESCADFRNWCLGLKPNSPTDFVLTQCRFDGRGRVGRKKAVHGLSG